MFNLLKTNVSCHTVIDHDPRLYLLSVPPKQFSSNSEAFSSELLETHEDMFPWYFMLTADSNLQPHSSVSPVVKGLNNPFRTAS